MASDSKLVVRKHRVNGHYFWCNDAGQLLPTASGQVKGSISNTPANPNRSAL